MNVAIVLLAGEGKRFKSKRSKNLTLINKKPLFSPFLSNYIIMQLLSSQYLISLDASLFSDPYSSPSVAISNAGKNHAAYLPGFLSTSCMTSATSTNSMRDASSGLGCGSLSSRSFRSHPIST